MAKEIIYRKLSELKKLPNNPRTIKKDDMERLKKSIKDNPDYFEARPIILSNRTGDLVILAGNQRYEAAKALKMDEVPTFLLEGLTEAREREIIIRDNVSNGDWDMDALANEWDTQELTDWGLGLDWDEPEQEVVEDEAPEVSDEPADSVLGGVYQLGRHRLMCGDSTDAGSVAILMDGQQSKLLFTSPPYSDMREYNGDKKLDVLTIANFIVAYKPYVFTQCVNLDIQRKNGEIYTYWDDYIKIARECGYKFLAWNVWDKGKCGSIGQQSAFVPIRHEWIFVFGKEVFDINKTWEKKSKQRLDAIRRVRQPDGSMKISSRGDMSNPLKSMESVVSVNSENGGIRKEHPAVFPVALATEYIKSMSNIDDIITEPFGGSGSTLIACEQLGRKCYMMELDTKYCDVIRKRYWKFVTGSEEGWQDGTGKIAN